MFDFEIIRELYNKGETIVCRLKSYFFHNVYSEVIKNGIKRSSFHRY